MRGVTRHPTCAWHDGRYGTRALELLQRYYEGELADLTEELPSPSPAAPAANGSPGMRPATP